VLGYPLHDYVVVYHLVKIPRRTYAAHMLAVMYIAVSSIICRCCVVILVTYC
jgi:hypothetical protein